MRHRHHRQTRRRQPRQIAEDVAAPHEILDAIAQQVRAGAFDKLHIGQPVLQRHFLHPQRLVEAIGLQRTGIDAGIVGAHHAANSGDKTDTRNYTGTRYASVRIRHIEHVTGQRRQFDERRTGVEHQRHPLARQQLPAFMEAILGGCRCGARAFLQHPHLVDQRQHAGTIGLEGFTARGNRRFNHCHVGTVSPDLLRGPQPCAK